MEEGGFQLQVKPKIIQTSGKFWLNVKSIQPSSFPLTENYKEISLKAIRGHCRKETADIFTSHQNVSK